MVLFENIVYRGEKAPSYLETTPYPSNVPEPSPFEKAIYRGEHPPSLGMPKHRIISPNQIEIVEPTSLISKAEMGAVGAVGLLGSLTVAGILGKMAYDYFSKPVLVEQEKKE